MYGGLGLGGYFDTIEMDTPLSGVISSTYFSLGLSVRIGLELVIGNFLSIVPETKIHFILGPGMYAAINATYGGGLILYF